MTPVMANRGTPAAVQVQTLRLFTEKFHPYHPFFVVGPPLANTNGYLKQDDENQFSVEGLPMASKTTCQRLLAKGKIGKFSGYNHIKSPVTKV
jgi:hypothetical protein